jgi:hypothetical protein
MNFDDTARIFGPSEKLAPHLFELSEKRSPLSVTVSSKGAVPHGQFNCLLCNTPMVWGPATQVTNGRLVRVKDRNRRVFEQWNCPSCGFFYKPLVAGTIPKQYQAKLSEPSQSVTKLCLDCRRVVVGGIKRYCAKCLSARQRKVKRESARKRRSNVDKTKNSLIGAQAFTHGELSGGYNHPQTPFLASEISTEQPQKGGVQ